MKNDINMNEDSFVISDWHIGHRNILNFTNRDGKRFRGDLFKDVDDMNNQMVVRHNSVVGPNDHVLFMGDVFFGDPYLAADVLARMNGKRFDLILGNHDDPKSAIIQKYFASIKLIHNFKPLGVVFSHMPLHAQQMIEKDWIKWNVHGHIHQNKAPEGNYINVSVEALDYTPIRLKNLLKKFEHKHV